MPLPLTHAPTYGLYSPLSFHRYVGTFLRHIGRTEQPELFQMQPPAEISVAPMLAFGANDVVALIRVQDMSTIQMVVVACAFVRHGEAPTRHGVHEAVSGLQHRPTPAQ